jgi:prepilin-type N-terminal cleavage/methylation domain-containing protein
MEKHGFSLIEILVTLGIFSLIILVLVNFQISLFSQNTFISNSLNADSEMRTALKKMVAEIRGAAQSDTGAYQIGTATKNSLTFFSDVNGDGRREQIRYFLIGTSLMRGLIKPTGNPLTYVVGSETLTTLVHSIANPNQEIFAYYDQNYAGTQTALAEPINIPLVRLIKITLTVDADPNKPPAPLTLGSQVSIRSLKY